MKQAAKTITNCITHQELIEQLRFHGVRAGMVIEVHAALSSLGYVVGGAQAVIDALIEVVGYSGTILMSLQTGNNSEPTYWRNPPIAYDLVQKIRKNTPIFNKKDSDTLGMGAIVENFRRREGVVVSNHPRNSYVAWGKYAKLLCNRHSLHFSLSEESPTARLTELKGYVLLLGCDYDCCTVMHLAEYRTDCRPILVQGSSVEIEGKQVWKKHLDMDINSVDFLKIGKRMETKNKVQQFLLGIAPCKLFRSDIAVEEAVHYFEKEGILTYYK